MGKTSRQSPAGDTCSIHSLFSPGYYVSSIV